MEKYDTLKYYNENAEHYCESTINGDMKEDYDKFLSILPSKAHILDFGCGSGRDSKYFLDNGYIVRAIDGSKKLCEIASNYIGQRVECMKFDELSDKSLYDGIWACASIIHVEREKLPEILKKMVKALKDDGVIYTCFKLGNKEVVEEGKYFNYLNKNILESILNKVDLNLKIIDYYETGSFANVNRPQTTWGNYLIKK